jgi:hypothetical protein
MLENGQLMAKCDIFQGDLFVTTADENQESNCHEKLVQHAAMSVRTSDKRINRLIILWDFGEAQLWDLLWWFFGPLTILPLWQGKKVDWSYQLGVICLAHWSVTSSTA